MGKRNKQNNGKHHKKPMNGKFQNKNFEKAHRQDNKAQPPRNGASNIKPMNKNKKNAALGQYGDFVGKSMFKIIPEGAGEAEVDNFAALGQDEEMDDEEIEYNSEQIAEDGQFGNEEEEYPDQQDEMEFQGGAGEQNCDQCGDPAEDGQEYEDMEDEDDDNEDIEGEEEYEEDEEMMEGQQEQDGQEGEEGQEEQEGVMNDQQQSDPNVDISVVNLKIQQVLQVLMSVERLGQGKPRKYYLEKLRKYLHRYYGYNFQLIDHFLNFLNPTELVQFFESNQTQRPLSIRTNTLKTRRKQLAQALIQRGVNLDPLADWSNVGIKIYDTKVPIGATPEYLAGQYMLQSASSLLPVIALDPQMNEKILDMAAAPGGKTSYIAQLMKNTGCLFANDLKKDRLRALQFNLYRLGITNTVVTCRDGRKYPQIFPNSFDRVLLDAPCTGLGIISKDPSIKANRVLIDIYKNSHVQKQLLLAAIDSTRVGGVVVYSTCSVSPLQNEQVVNYALKKRYVKIVDMDELIDVGEPGLTKFVEKRYHVDLKKTRRIYPHIVNMDGFYYAKIVKIANGAKQTKAKEKQQEEQVPQLIDIQEPEQPQKKIKKKKLRALEQKQQQQQQVEEEEAPEPMPVEKKKKKKGKN